MYIKIVDLVVKLYAPRLLLDLVLPRLKFLEMYLEVSVQPQNMKTIDLDLDFKKKKSYKGWRLGFDKSPFNDEVVWVQFGLVGQFGQFDD